MTNIIVKANGTSIVASADGKLTSGMVGVPVSIEYDVSWSGLTKTISFRVGNFVRSREGVANVTTVPWEVMRHSGRALEVGIEGRDQNGNIVMPTIWATVSTIYSGANASIPAAPNPENENGDGGTGVDGTTFYPSVSSDGIISWTNDGGKANPDPVDLTSAVVAALPIYNGEVVEV